ncbi:hypothetical protein MferCBS31731_005902 [Microsporum ferrugineum]
MSCVSGECRPKTKSEQRDERRKLAARFDGLTKKLEEVARLQQHREDTRIEKYSCINLTEEDIGSPGHTPQRYRDAYQDFTDLYGNYFDDDDSVTGTEEDSKPGGSKKDEDCESVASDSTTASEKYNMYSISESVLRMAIGFPGWVPIYPKKNERVYGTDSTVSSASPPTQVKETQKGASNEGYRGSMKLGQNASASTSSPDKENKKGGGLDSVHSVTFSPSPGADNVEFGPHSPISLSPPPSPTDMLGPCDSGSVYSLSSPANNDNMDPEPESEDEDEDKDAIIYPSIEGDDQTELPSTQPEGDSDATLSDPDREDSDSVSGTSYDSTRRINKPVNHKFFHLHHRVPKRPATPSSANGNIKRSKVRQSTFLLNSHLHTIRK